MLIKGSQHYLTLIQSYDTLYKQYYISSYQIPKLVSLTVAFSSNGMQLKYLIYTLIFLNIKTLQKPYLLFKKQIKISLISKQGTFIGCKIKLRKHNMVSFLTDFQQRLYPLLIVGNPATMYQIEQKNFTIHLNNLAKGYPEMEVFYSYFQQIQGVALTFECSVPQYLSHLLSQFQIPIARK